MVNALLMITLVRPIVRLTVSRWRRQARAAAPAVISVPVQELFEAALIEELSPPVVELEPVLPVDLEPPAEPEPLKDLEALAEAVVVEATGRSLLRTLLIAGVLITVVSISIVAIANLLRRRREAEAEAEREWVAVPVGSEEAEAIEEAEEIAAAAE